MYYIRSETQATETYPTPLHDCVFASNPLFPFVGLGQEQGRIKIWRQAGTTPVTIDSDKLDRLADNQKEQTQE